MTVLPDSDRQLITTGLMRHWSSLFDVISDLSKSELKSAIDATDLWIEDNQASFNTALPVLPRNNLTMAQKTLIFCVVAAFRVSKQFAIRLIGGID